MNRKLSALIGGIAAATTTAGLLLVAGCAGTPQAPTQSGFLSQYIHLKKVDATTSRYIFKNRLALYNKFEITTVKVLPEQFDGKFLTEEQKAKAIAYIRESITKALAEHGYPVVTSGGPDVGQIRVAITAIYKTGDQLGLSVEGEILDASSGFQAAAVTKTALGDIYLGSWWDNVSARQIVDAWSQRLAEAVDAAHGK